MRTQPKGNSEGTKKVYTKKQKLTLTTVTALVFLVLFTLLGELAVRIFSDVKYAKKKIPSPYDTAQKDEYLGWKMTPNYSFSGQMKDQEGRAYEVEINYDENGFKAFGDLDSPRPKVLFLGDSYTASIEVSNGKSFFNLIGDSLGLEVFAYGHAGFGTLQEYMIFDRWVEIIRPDLVVWEVCSNDFIDNHAPLEIVCGYKVGQRRPYLGKNGEIYYRRPLSAWQRAKEALHFYAWIDERWKGVKANLFGIEPRTGEYYLSTQKRGFKPFDESVKVTEDIVALARERVPGNTKILGFSADSYQPQLDEFARIFEQNGFSFTAAPTFAIDSVSYGPGKIAVRAADGYHWNEAGHEIIAKSLSPYIQGQLEGN